MQGKNLANYSAGTSLFFCSHEACPGNYYAFPDGQRHKKNRISPAQYIALCKIKYMPVKEKSPWSKQVKKLPDWIALSILSEAAGLEKSYLHQVKLGRTGLSTKQAKAVIKELKSLKGIVEYGQGTLFSNT